MGNILSKIADMEEEGTLPKFNPNYYVDVLDLASKKRFERSSHVYCNGYCKRKSKFNE